MDTVQIDMEKSKNGSLRDKSRPADNRESDFSSVVKTDPVVRHPENRVNKKILNYLAEGVQNEKPDMYLKKLTSMSGSYSGVSDGNIVVFTGAGRALRAIINEYITYGDEILCCGPGPDLPGDLAAGVGAHAVEYNSPSLFTPDPDGIISQISSKTKLIYLGNPDFITGAVCNPGEIEYILSRVGQIKMIVDESLFEYCGISTAGLIENNDNLIILRTFSHGWELQGVACDYLLTSERNSAALRRTASKKLSTITLVGAIAAMAGLEQEKPKWENIRENMIYLSTRLRSMGLACRPTAADFIIIKVSNPHRTANHLRSAEIDAVSLHRYAGMDNYISVRVRDDRYSANIIRTIESMPKELRGLELPRKSRLILKRRNSKEQKIKNPENISQQSRRELKVSGSATK